MGALAGACQVALWSRLEGGATGQLAAAGAGSQLAAGGGDPGRPAANAAVVGSTQLLAVALAAVGMPVDLQGPCPLCVGQLRRAELGWHLQEVGTLRCMPCACKLAHSLATAGGCQLRPAEDFAPAQAWARCGSNGAA